MIKYIQHKGYERLYRDKLVVTHLAGFGGGVSGPGETSGFQGTTSGYTSGGHAPPDVDIIDKYAYASDANATDVGDITEEKAFIGGTSSSTNGYTHGGMAGSNSDVIDKFPFASDTNAADVGDLTVARRYIVGSSSSANHGYCTGGYD